MSDAVNHPDYYGGADNPFEVIKVIEGWGLDSDFHLATAVKYIARAGKKDPAKETQDLEKAAFYLHRAITKRQQEQAVDLEMTQPPPVAPPPRFTHDKTG